MSGMLAKEFDDILIAVAEIKLCQGELNPDELSCVSEAVPKRVREFTAGRILARRTLSAMNVRKSSILADENRCPLWPGGIVGSISHTDDRVGVALARANNYLSLGFDIEARGAVTSELQEIVLTKGEKARIEGNSVPDFATLVFSCKESIYKAVFPLVGEFFEFHDIEIDLTDEGFTARCLNDLQSKPHIEGGKGLFEIHADLVKTLFLIT